MLLISIFSPETANRWWWFLSDRFLFFWTVFQLFQLEQPVAVVNSYFLRMFSPFPDFFTFPDHKLQLQFLVLRLLMVSQMSPVSGYPAVLQRCWLHLSRLFLVSRLAVLRLTGIFFVSISADIFCSVFFPLQLGQIYGCSHHFYGKENKTKKWSHADSYL